MQEFSCTEVIYTQATLKGLSRLHVYIYISISNGSDKVGPSFRDRIMGAVEERKGKRK